MHPRRISHFITTGMAAALPALLGGCLVYQVVKVPVKVAATTVEVAGDAAGAVVVTTGKVAVKTVRATGSVAETGFDSIDATARLARTGMVTFADAANGAVVRVPWREGLTLAEAGQAARVRVAARTVAILREGKMVAAASAGAGGGYALRPGDVVRLAR